MKKELRRKITKDLELALFISILLLLIIFGIYKPIIIGFVTYQISSNEKIWDFTNPEEYSYDNSLINLSNGVRLIPNIKTIKIENYSYENYYVTKALYDPSDKTSKVNALDDERLEVYKNKIFDLIFEQELNNGDVIYLYIKDGSADEIFLCDIGEECNSPGYGKVDYDGEEGLYNLTIFGLNEAKKLFNINQDKGNVRYNYIYAKHNDVEVPITKALYESYDKTEKIYALDNNRFLANKNNIFNFIFDHKIQNSDVISLYIKSGSSSVSEIYLCNLGEECASPGYGKVSYNGDVEGWYNITVSGLNEEVWGLNIDPDVNIDYVYAHRFIDNSYNIFNITYPRSAVIDTQDLIINDFGRWDLLTKNEELNNQQINYYYSTDSGNSWNLIDNFNLSYASNHIIRLRANLTSDTINSPVLNSLSLKYLKSIACQENWHCADWEPVICQRDGAQTRACVDLNECGSEDNKPEITRNCIYNCSENWALHYSECRNDDTKLIYYVDEENCGTINNLPEDNGSALACDYCLPNWVCVTYDICNANIQQKECNEVVDTNYCYELTGLESDNIVPNLNLYCTEFSSNSETINNILNYNFNYNNKNILNINLNNSELFVNLEIINNIANGSISVINYKDNIKNETIDTGLKYFDINAGDNIKNNLNSNKIKIYYTDEEVNNKNLDEETLKIYYYNNGVWEELNSTLNKTGKYLEINLDHLSYYGIFGKEKTIISIPTPSSGGEGGGMGGGYILPEPKGNKETVKEEIKNYEIESSIENSISFVDNNKYLFNIKNKGEKIDKIELSLNDNIVRLSNNLIENLDKENNIELSLITDPILTRTKSNLLIQGFAAKMVEEKTQDIPIQLNILGISENKIVVNKTIPLTAKVIVFDKISNERILPYNIIVIGLLVISLIFILKFYRKGKKKKKGRI